MINKGYMTAKTDAASDENYTPAYAVRPLLKYLTEPKTIWCPFDTSESEFVKILSTAGHRVVASHIDEGKNFFFYEPENYDIIISNPPFSIKDDILKRLKELNKPFAILYPLPAIQGKRRYEYIKDCQLLVFDKRINFYTDKERKVLQKGVAFATVYLCKNFLPKDLIFEELEVD